ncbi:MAG: U32 family peptidase [Bacteroidaceae bacterium]|nr:U32 family peptidase [Bacteroidaceae bacterium]
MKEQRSVELLAPARNLETGIEAIRHGADAVYIGASRFGARAAAGNSVEDISALVRFAHTYWARVFVTVNTILEDAELKETEKLIWELYGAGVDAILVQDMAVLRMNLPPIALHASTQMDVRTVEKVRFLAGCGFSRVVLARELSLDQIREIHDACPDVELECFVHGALCVSYSGQCYASQCCFGRSANRGECAQFCRLPFDLVDSEGKVAVRQKHLLSLKDMNRMDYLEQMMDAGVVSMKIEGRLKETGYVKNVVAAYSTRLNEIIRGRDDLRRASTGVCTYSFAPDVRKSFNRQFTGYFIDGKRHDDHNIDTPKAVGMPMGQVLRHGPGWMDVSSVEPFHNGDGICFSGIDGTLRGYRVNRVDGRRIFLHSSQEELRSGRPVVQAGTTVFRNSDTEFDRMLAKESADRKIHVSVSISEIRDGYVLEMTDSDGVSVIVETHTEKQDARTPQDANIRNQLGKLGNTCFKATLLDVRLQGERFIPSSLLADMRRQAVAELENKRIQDVVPLEVGKRTQSVQYPKRELSYLGNVMNHEARAFYLEHGVERVGWAYEKQPVHGAPVMFCRHCVRYALGWCPKHQKAQTQYREPFFLRSSDGREFQLSFDCRNCQMTVLEP